MLESFPTFVNIYRPLFDTKFVFETVGSVHHRQDLRREKRYKGGGEENRGKIEEPRTKSDQYGNDLGME